MLFSEMATDTLLLITSGKLSLSVYACLNKNTGAVAHSVVIRVIPMTASKTNLVLFIIELYRQVLNKKANMRLWLIDGRCIVLKIQRLMKSGSNKMQARI